MFFLKKISLKLRLTLLFGLIFTGMLCGFCYFLYNQFSTLQQTEFDSSLYNYTVDVAESLDIDKYGDVEFDSSLLNLNEKILPFKLKNSFISVFDIYGKIIETRPAENEPILPLTELLIDDVLVNEVTFLTAEFNEVTYRIINYQLSVLKKDTPLILQISVPTTDILKIRGNLIRIFYILVPIMLFISLFMGYFFVGRALLPMMKIIAKSKKIEVSNLKDRVPVPETKDELWQLADTINHLLGRLEESFIAQERFIQDASHQLKTPLAVMKGELEVFQAEAKTEKEISEFLISMSQEINFLITLTNNLLILARADSGAINLSFTKNRIDEVVISQVSRLSKFASMKKISLQVDFDSFYNASEEELTVLSDRELLGVIFYNLIENALKYSPMGSVVKVQGIHSKNSLEVIVSDEGPGIAKENLEKVFDRFFRQQKSETIVQGSGLGLAICKVVSDSMNAQIWVVSTPNGSLFHFKVRT